MKRSRLATTDRNTAHRTCRPGRRREVNDGASASWLGTSRTQQGFCSIERKPCAKRKFCTHPIHFARSRSRRATLKLSLSFFRSVVERHVERKTSPWDIPAVFHSISCGTGPFCEDCLHTKKKWPAVGDRNLTDQECQPLGRLLEIFLVCASFRNETRSRSAVHIGRSASSEPDAAANQGD
jgi:hypothetical protein